ncbi:Pyrophosphate--fructose 6-phosphate 1-phosphotransferase [Limihaloglobus sulfuriphilus]|uniref:Pyrophosphate--fructose 6-phosphate 1-phosphotransferase n=1 Tax=Limihaloglobus sulfuriphilus TaxID=1851148 RepID=A0A1Q2MED8_9BACT|nr:6-phosphofructokinase [Limihaloglobus sulfuriphilus]AQQ71065.1 Pyrophosphate--fructose 6-phosphate 1-phosphotransferase [Limihaloglobus sulfuriphilus]
MLYELKGNAVVSQSGGPTGVINASLVGVIEAAQKNPNIEKIYGAVHAVAGMVRDEFVDLTDLDAETLEIIAGSPSSALGSSRDKPDAEYCRNIVEVLKKRGIRYFFYIGGNDSANTCKIVNEQADKLNYDIRAFHVPKTIDNDLRTTDHCPGYGTAAQFVARALKGDDLDNRALPGVKIDVIMGRDAGWLTAAASLAKDNEDDGPHLIYVPERPVSMEKFVSDVQMVYAKYGRCVVAVSEGIRDEDNVTWAKKLAENAEVDAHGNVQLSGTGALADFLAGKIKANTEIKRVRADTFGYLQRSFAGLQSKVDAEEARETGRKAVEFSMEFDSGSAIMKRVGSGADYKVEFERTELANVAEFTKDLPDEFINEAGNGITDAYKEYALPLVGELPKTGYLGNLPKV